MTEVRVILKQISRRLSWWRVKLCWEMATSYCTEVISSEKSRVNTVPVEGKGHFSHSSLFLGFGAFIGHICIHRVLLKFFSNKYFRARTPNDIHYRGEEEKKHIRSHSFIIHTASFISEKNDYMSSQHFLRHVLRINNKKHANFMDEYLTYQKGRTLFFRVQKKNAMIAGKLFFFFQISILAINFPFHLA